MRLPLITRLDHYDGTYRIVGRGSGQSEWAFYKDGYGKGRAVQSTVADKANGFGCQEDKYADYSGMNPLAVDSVDWLKECFYGYPKDCVSEPEIIRSINDELL